MNSTKFLHLSFNANDHSRISRTVFFPLKTMTIKTLSNAISLIGFFLSILFLLPFFAIALLIFLKIWVVAWCALGNVIGVVDSCHRVFAL